MPNLGGYPAGVCDADFDMPDAQPDLEDFADGLPCDCGALPETLAVNGQPLDLADAIARSEAGLAEFRARLAEAIADADHERHCATKQARYRREEPGGAAEEGCRRYHEVAEETC